jgi:predicted TIM-barrel fold metal-dependent hydrolase
MTGDGADAAPWIVDSLCNAFTPDRRAVWDDAIAAAGTSVTVRRDPEDSFAEPAALVARMDELAIRSVLVPTGDVGRHGRVDPLDFEHVAARWDEAEQLARRWPGRFAALALIDPEGGMGAVRALRTRLADPWVVGAYLHTHSFDRRLDHADYYPFCMGRRSFI